MVAEEGATYAVWYRLLLQGMGVSFFGPIVLYQDNKNAIIMAVQGGTFQRTKHLRQSYIRERIELGDIMLKFKPTKEMEADILTKPLPRSVLNKLKTRLCFHDISQLKRSTTYGKSDVKHYADCVSEIFVYP